MSVGSSRKLRELIKNAGKVLVISHRKPDADTLGSAISMRIMLERKGKRVTLACIDMPGESFSFLPHIADFKQEFVLSEYDLMIIVDAGASYMTNFHLRYSDMFKSDIPIVNIDHHALNDFFGDVNIVEPKAASTTVLLYRLFREWGEEIDEDMATCLLAGIYGDTGSFMHSNTSSEVYEIAADLMNRGAAIAEISEGLFNSNSINSLRIWGRAMERATVTDDNVVMSVIQEDDFKKLGATPDELSGVIDYLNMVPDSKFTVLINEDRNGNVKGSFRTRNENIDLSRIAAVFGGGGHQKASGFSVPGKLKPEVRYTIVSEDLSKKSLDF